MTSPNFATHAPTASATALEEVDALVSRLASKKDWWIRTTHQYRAQILRSCIDRTVAVAEDWVRAACRAKGIDLRGPRALEEWAAGPMTTIRNLRLLAQTLDQGGEARLPGLTQRPDGQWVAKVFPETTLDSVVFGGFTAEVWIEPGEEPTRGQIYRDKLDPKKLEQAKGRVSLVLGAGNVGSIGPMDALHKLFVEDEVVILKTNPVNAYLQPYWEESFRPLIEAGVFAVVRGGADVGKHLVHHAEVDTIHMTGSDRTFDAIVWGANAEEQATRKAKGDKVVDKPINAELGAVTPVLVVPGPWTDKDLDYHARNVTGMVANNASFNCNAAKVLVTSERWPLRQRFVEAVEHHLSKTPPRNAYYPGAQDRYDGFLEAYPNARPLGPRSSAVVPWTVLPDVPPRAGEYAFTNEAFCGVLAETALPSRGPAEFLSDMVEFANGSCWGTLSCMIIIHPATAKAYAKELDAAIANLRYGGIAINAWAGVIYALVSPTWGAFPGHPDEDIRSGRGTVHNTFMIDHPQKSVVRVPFHIDPTPAWFTDHKTGHLLGPELVKLEANPSFLRLPPLLAAAMRG